MKLKEIATGNLSQNNQTTVPREVRTELGLSGGDFVKWIRDGDRVFLVKDVEKCQRMKPQLKKK